ncbi:MAG: hypothetical protein V4662_01215 [Verrucomicrobiota bacterium]
MSRRLALLLLWLPIPSVLMARIGETPTQCVVRYGEPIQVDKEAMKTFHRKAGLIVCCEFVESKCAKISFTKEEKDALGVSLALSHIERQALMEANAPGSKWQQDRSPLITMEFWTAGEMVAIADKVDPIFSISTKTFMARFFAEKEEEEKAKLKGF